MTIEERAERAVELKLYYGYNCAQAVSAVLADETDLSEEQLKSISAGFCAGMGTTEATCGALIAAGMIAGAKTGGNRTLALTRQLITRFKTVCGATACKDLKGVETGKTLCSCEDCVRNAVRIYGEVFGLY